MVEELGSDIFSVWFYMKTKNVDMVKEKVKGIVRLPAVSSTPAGYNLLIKLVSYKYITVGLIS